MARKKESREFVEIVVPRTSRNQADLFVCVNSESFLIKRGVPVRVPDYVVDVIQNSLDQDQKTMDFIASHASN